MEFTVKKNCNLLIYLFILFLFYVSNYHVGFFLYSTLSKLVSVVCVCIYGLHDEEQLDVLDVKSPPLRCGDAATELLARKTENKESEAGSKRYTCSKQRCI